MIYVVEFFLKFLLIIKSQIHIGTFINAICYITVFLIQQISAQKKLQMLNMIILNIRSGISTLTSTADLVTTPTI